MPTQSTRKKAKTKTNSNELSATVYDQGGTEKGQIKLSPIVFGAKINKALMAQAVRVRLANARLGTRKTKSRGEVSGGGRKPWRQKGTGRARHGSVRSPLWRGGGHAHPLAATDFGLKMPTKMKRRALFSALSARLKNHQVMVLDQLKLEGIKTRELYWILQGLPVKGKTLLVIPTKDENVELSARNLPRLKTLEARLLNAYDVLGCQTLLILKGGLRKIEETFVVDQGERKE